MIDFGYDNKTTNLLELWKVVYERKKIFLSVFVLILCVGVFKIIANDNPYNKADFYYRADASVKLGMVGTKSYIENPKSFTASVKHKFSSPEVTIKINGVADSAGVLNIAVESENKNEPEKLINLIIKSIMVKHRNIFEAVMKERAIERGIEKKYKKQYLLSLMNQLNEISRKIKSPKNSGCAQNDLFQDKQKIEKEINLTNKAIEFLTVPGAITTKESSKMYNFETQIIREVRNAKVIISKHKPFLRKLIPFALYGVIVALLTTFVSNFIAVRKK